MKAIGLALALIVAGGASPAEACHRFSVWKYPWPQQCAAAVPNFPILSRISGKRPSPIPLPALEPIDWGQPADDEARARIELRALLEAK